MLTDILERIMPYKIIMPHTLCHEHQGDHSSMVQEAFSSTEKFFTKRGFERRIAQLESRSRGRESSDWFLLYSSRPDERTYIAVPDIMPLEPGTYSFEVPEEFRQFFDPAKHRLSFA